MKVYLAGPTRGIAEFNFPVFFAAAFLLRGTGDEAQAVQQHGFSLRDALAADLVYICNHADAIALLPGWERSKGVAAELATARALGLKEIYL